MSPYWENFSDCLITLLASWRYRQQKIKERNKWRNHTFLNNHLPMLSSSDIRKQKCTNSFNEYYSGAGLLQIRIAKDFHILYPLTNFPFINWRVNIREKNTFSIFVTSKNIVRQPKMISKNTKLDHWEELHLPWFKFESKTFQNQQINHFLIPQSIILD